jgi:ketosteroid isomerase-like protein
LSEYSSTGLGWKGLFPLVPGQAFIRVRIVMRFMLQQAERNFAACMAQEIEVTIATSPMLGWVFPQGRSPNRKNDAHA